MMGLRSQLKEMVASCATKQTQHATFVETGATGNATKAQQHPENPHEIWRSGATHNATITQQVEKGSATEGNLEPVLRVAFTRTRNSQLSSLTAHRLAGEVIAAAMRRCDQFNDSEQARSEMRQQCLELSPALQRDLLDHFNGKPANLG